MAKTSNCKTAAQRQPQFISLFLCEYNVRVVYLFSSVETSFSVCSIQYVHIHVSVHIDVYSHIMKGSASSQNFKV